MTAQTYKGVLSNIKKFKILFLTLNCKNDGPVNAFNMMIMNLSWSAQQHCGYLWCTLQTIKKIQQSVETLNFTPLTEASGLVKTFLLLMSTPLYRMSSWSQFSLQWLNQEFLTSATVYKHLSTGFPIHNEIVLIMTEAERSKQYM